MSITNFELNSCFVKITLATVTNYREVEVGSREIKEGVCQMDFWVSHAHWLKVTKSAQIEAPQHGQGCQLPSSPLVTGPSPFPPNKCSLGPKYQSCTLALENHSYTAWSGNMFEVCSPEKPQMNHHPSEFRQRKPRFACGHQIYTKKVCVYCWPFKTPVLTVEPTTTTKLGQHGSLYKDNKF